ncbi:protein of unknown function [Pseudobutyrivibrio sp. YE44]|uniref:DUF4153 domain-containing protein n=1 Tax=Pseudobutyrivibrio sp. YE44 TaxID=1520802 RepID=UPI000888BE88|nr:DUF4153 domain-containing protein [Pseudobutyrivibrio sp. YE44]SDB43667.1 protein of unknown function [Pseudobutyrivibrio sp. YE44]
MKIIEKVKNIFKDAIREHRCSMIVFLLAMVCLAINYNCLFHFGDYEVELIGDTLDFASRALAGTALSVLLCEAIHLYKRDEEGYKWNAGKNLLTYGLIVLAGFLAVLQNWLVIKELCPWINDDNHYSYVHLSNRVLFCVLVTIVGLTIFYFFKRSGQSFESYLAKAFCGLMKAELVYGIVAIGTLVILWAFDTLIIDTSAIDLIERIEILLIALVQFPCAVSGLSKTEAPLGKFAKVLLSYVFTILTAIAFVIIYIYIIKILVTWTFPSNQVFTILAALFSGGVIVWTMAQGCCDDSMVKPLKVMPLLFLPFIVLQIMCLTMRVQAHGFTDSRYFGLALIVAEIVYFIIYIINLIQKKEIMFFGIFIVVVGSYLVYLVPGINVASVVTTSQAKIIEKYLAKGESASPEEKEAAYSAYFEIETEVGLSPMRYIASLSEEQKQQLEEYSKSNEPASAYKDTFYISANADVSKYDVEGYNNMYIIYRDYESEDDILECEIDKVPIYVDENIVGTVDLSEAIDQLLKLEKNGDGYDSEQTSKIINQTFGVKDEQGNVIGQLVIRWINIEGEYSITNKVTELSIEGYYLE